MLDADIDSINISLDSINPVIHDSIRGVKGTHKKVLRAIDDIGEFGCKKKIILATVIMESNIDEIIPLAEFTVEKDLFGISYQVLTDNFGRKYKHNWYQESDNFVRSKKNLDEVINQLIGLKDKGYPVLNSKRQ